MAEQHVRTTASPDYELSIASLYQSDFDFAYKLQLEEAFRASCSSVGLPYDSRQGLDDVTLSPSSPADRSLAFSIQRLELSRSQQEDDDSCLFSLEYLRLTEELRRRAHDRRFAQSLEDIGDSDWESHGDLCEDPFVLDSWNEDEPALYRLYVTAMVSPEDDPVYASVGAVIMDEDGIVLTEISKPLESGAGKGFADYMALITGLEAIMALRLQHVEVHTDSVIVYNQITKRWRIRSQRLQKAHSQVMDLVRNLTHFHLDLIPRNELAHALRLARQALYVVSRSQNVEKTDEAEHAKEVCTICLEDKSLDEMCIITGCSHRFCNSCIVQHAEVKVQAGQVPVRCPQVDCIQTLSQMQCESILSEKWSELLKKRLIEINMPEAERVYCPFPKCSALMNKKTLIASSQGPSTSAMVTAATCVECSRTFCVECRVPWHALMTCQQFQQLPPYLRDAQDSKLYQLAENKNWKRCKKCRRMIELTEGCFHMTCRCGYEFCYSCGEPWKNKRQSCKCKLWDEDYLLNEPLSDSDEENVSVELNSEYDDDYEASEDFEELNVRFINDRSSPLWNPYYKTQLCRYFERGCYWGDSCKFAHGTDELRSR